MCDINIDKLETQQLMSNDKKVQHGSICMKCKEIKASVVVRINDPMCRSCFLTYTTHKFRSTLGKSKLIKPNDKILLALSSGHSSTAMLHLVKEALSEGAHKRLKFMPGVVYIDESAMLPDVKHNYINIQNMVEQCSYPFYRIPIYEGFQSSSSDEGCNDKGEDNRRQFCETFSTIKCFTTKNELLMATRMAVITNTARKHSYTKIMTGETATTLSMKLLCNVAQGRGATILQDIGVADKRYLDLTIIRPMRELSSKEVAMYNRFYDIHVSVLPNINTMKNKSSSLHRQTEEFVIGLQAEFPSTVNTVFRTGDKLCMKENLNCHEEEKCVMCQSYLVRGKDNVTTDLNASDSGNCGSSGGCCGSSEECDSKRFSLSPNDVRSQLCYGCTLTFKDMDYRVEHLSKHVIDSASSQIKRNRLKEKIEDFLLK